MPLILHIETSAKYCSVVLSRDGEVLFSKVDSAGSAHSVQLGLFVDEALSYAESCSLQIQAVAVSSGPGSYTGLRIGVSMAKGLCYSRDLPLIAIPTLDLLASEVIRRYPVASGDAVCPMVDARRMEVYAALYSGSQIKESSEAAVIVDENSFSGVLSDRVVWFAGDAAAKCKPVLTHPNARFVDDLVPLAAYMIDQAEMRYKENKFEDVAYFEPFYLKDFVATVSKKSIIPVPER